MPLGTRLRTWTFVACVAVAAAPPRWGRADEPSSANVQAARRHFERARAFYGQGAYREAITELEAARALDPNAKDLVFNLGVVHEKLSDIDEALKWFRLYTTMDLVPQERDRADAYIRRLEGAKKELDEKQAAATPPLGPPTARLPESPTEPRPQSTPPPGGRPAVRGYPPRPEARPRPALPPEPAPPPPFGRIDGLTVASASVSAGALVFGAIMAIKAKGDQPVGTFVTGRNISAPELQSRVDAAYREAVLADVAFAAALVSGIATGYLYFGRPRAAARPTALPAVSAAPLAAGGLLLVRGRF